MFIILVGRPVLSITGRWLLTSDPRHCSSQPVLRFRRWLVAKAGGERGLRAWDACCMYCCETSNPVVQIVYLSIVIGFYLLYCKHLFALLPNPGAAEYHM